MHAIFHAAYVIADVTDNEFLVFGYQVSGTCEPGMLVRFRPKARLGRDYVLHSIELNDMFTELEHRPFYDLVIQCGTLEETEFLYSLQIRDEDIELFFDPDR
jgi:hypothetical protein